MDNPANHSIDIARRRAVLAQQQVDIALPTLERLVARLSEVLDVRSEFVTQ